MYNIWCEVKKINVILVVVGIILTIMPIFIDAKYDYSVLLITILLIIWLLKDILKYLSLKKHGVLIENVSYDLKIIKDNEKVLIVNYQLNDGNVVQLFKKKREWGNTLDNGTTKILINISNPKQYYIFDPDIC